MVKTPDFAAAFQDGAAMTDVQGKRVTMQTRELGLLNLPTGAVVACDPFLPEDEPFAHKVAPGTYPVVVSVAHYKNDQRVACARLRFTSAAPVRWLMALWPSQNMNDLDENAFFGYSVDSASGCFMDAQAAKRWQQNLDKYVETVYEQADSHYVDTWDWANLTLDEQTGLNIILFSSGMGDGLYASYWGLDAGGKTACLITDFGILKAK